MPMRRGDVFAGYTCEAVLREDAATQAYLVRHPRMPRLYTLTVFAAATSSDRGFRTRFERETDLSAALSHPNIAGIHDRGEFDGQSWIAVDHVEGHTVGQILRDRHSMGLGRADVVDIVAAVADALDYAHAHGVVHAGVSPETVLIADASGRRRIVLSGFATAKLVDAAAASAALTSDSVLHQSPEALMGETVDGCADQYSLAATAFHLLTGVAPFAHPNPAVVVSRHLTAPPPRLTDTRDGLGDLDEALGRALAKQRADRYSSCHEFAAALTRTTPVTVFEPLVAERPTTVPEAATVHSAPPVIMSTWGLDGHAVERLNSPDAPAPPRDSSRVLTSKRVSARVPGGRKPTPARNATNFWAEVGIDPIRIVLNAETLFTLRCYVDERAYFLGYRRMIVAFPSRQDLTTYLADDEPHDLSELVTFRPVVEAARAGSLALPVTPANTYALDGLQRDIEAGIDRVDTRQLELALELVLDVSEYTGDAALTDVIGPKEPLTQLISHVSGRGADVSVGVRLAAADQWRATSRRLVSHLRPAVS